MEPVTPQDVLDLYARLSEADVDVVLRHLGQHSTAEAVQVVVRNMPEAEQLRLVPLFVRPMVDAALPLLIRATVQVTREYPELDEDEVIAMVEERADQLTEAAVHPVREQERARLKAARDPKPRNTDRDDEIVRLYDQDGRTFGEIPLLLKLTDPSWVGAEGKPLSRDAVEKAYHRRKQKGT